jgi:membrane-bound lytic murein transglycosylase B
MRYVVRFFTSWSGKLLFPAFMLLHPVAVGAGIQQDFDLWLTDFRAEAQAAGISDPVLDQALAGLQPVPEILKRDRKQAETTLTLERYLSLIVTPERIDDGRKRWREHEAVLQKVAAEYGVQPRFILAIWGIETRFGAITGEHPVIPSLATLAFDVRRSSFFRSQLLDALRMVDRGHIELEKMRGSWAGAMGQPQFIPSSYLAYAQDFDGDGRRDIWSSEADVFASIANYLARHGWNDDRTWGREVKLSPELTEKLPSLMQSNAKGCGAMRSMTAEKTLPEWQKLGVRKADGSALPTRPLPAQLIAPDGPGGRTYLVYSNYRSILRYNCAHLYAVTVGTLADRIADQ